MKRRNFLKFLGLTAIAPKVAVDVLKDIQLYCIRPDMFSSLSERWVRISGTENYNGVYLVDPEFATERRM